MTHNSIYQMLLITSNQWLKAFFSLFLSISLLKRKKNHAQMHEMTNKADRNGRVVYLIETCPGPDIFVDGSIGIDCELRLWCHSFCCNSTVCEQGLQYPAELYGRNPEITKTTLKFTGYKYSLSVVHKLHPYGDLLTCTLPVRKIRQNTTLINSPKPRRLPKICA